MKLKIDWMRLPPAPASVMGLAHSSCKKMQFHKCNVLVWPKASLHRPLLLGRVYICFEFSRRTWARENDTAVSEDEI